jgi:hypothetical protein
MTNNYRSGWDLNKREGLTLEHNESIERPTDLPRGSAFSHTATVGWVSHPLPVCNLYIRICVIHTTMHASKPTLQIQKR